MKNEGTADIQSLCLGPKKWRKWATADKEAAVEEKLGLTEE